MSKATRKIGRPQARRADISRPQGVVIKTALSREELEPNRKVMRISSTFLLISTQPCTGAPPPYKEINTTATKLANRLLWNLSKDCKRVEEVLDDPPKLAKLMHN